MISADKKESREPALSAAHKQLLAERGISLETASANGIRSASSSEAKSVLGFDPKSSGIFIPFFHPVTGVIRTQRFRPDNPFVIEGKPAGKYLSPRGAGSLVYFPRGIDDKLKDVAEPLLITEGEFKTLGAVENGLLCVGLVGVWGWRARGANGESGPIADLDLIDVRGRVITIVFDSDAALNAQVRKARQALGKEFYRRGAALVLSVDLPSPDGVKVGLDDFLLAKGRDGFLELESVELPPTDIPPFSEPLSAMLNSPEEILEMGIEGIRPLRANGFSIAAPKTVKSWEMIAEGICLSTGKPLYGRFNVPKKRRVLIIEEEDNKRRVRRRLDRLIAAQGGEVPADDYFRISVKKGFRLDVAAWREVLEFEIKTFRPDFVYLDVFSRLHARDTNDNQGMAEIVLFLDQLNRDYESAFIILHHTRKNSAGGDPHDEILGSRVLGGFSESTLFFSKTKEKGVIKVEVSLKDEPENSIFEPEFLVRLMDTEDGRGTKIEYLGPGESKRAEDELRKRVMAALDDLEWRTVKQVAEVVNISKPTARGCLSTLFDLKLIARQNRGQARLYRKPEKAENFGEQHD
ncbi:MAG TPA: AAA family ATPase [Candidatus Binatia bacterium]